MEIAKVTSNGQITIPVSIRNSLNLQAGDKVLFGEKNGTIYIANASEASLENIQNAVKGKAKECGFETDEDIVTYVKNLR